MKLRTVGRTIALALGIVLAPLAAEAQPAAKVYRIGYLQMAPREQQTHLMKAFAEGMGELGYIEGRDISFEYRFAGGKPDRLPALAAELVRLKVDVILTATNPSTIAAKQATQTIPIVMAVGNDPVGAGLVASLARPGGNVTGLTQDVGDEIWGKRLELLKEAVPRLSRVAVVWNPAFPPNKARMNATVEAARRLGLTVQSVEVRGPTGFEDAFASAERGRAGGVLVLADPLMFAERSQIAALALKNRLPSIYAIREPVEVGGLMFYGATLADLFRRAATYVHKILNGVKPADLPVEQPSRFELVINLKTAKALGLTIPQSVLIRADHIIQ